jgi:hypothetical protein
LKAVSFHIFFIHCCLQFSKAWLLHALRSKFVTLNVPGVSRPPLESTVDAGAFFHIVVWFAISVPIHTKTN